MRKVVRRVRHWLYANGIVEHIFRGLAMAVKYVKDFEFSKDAGFSGSCGPMKKAMGGKVNGPLNRIMDAVRRSPQAQQMMAESMQRPEMAERPMQGAPQQPQPTMMRKGGKVTSKKGQAKVAKVMREYKKGELHSGSKKGPKVTNPKQAMAIALSEARKTKKAEGGMVEKVRNLMRDELGGQFTEKEFQNSLKDRRKMKELLGSQFTEKEYEMLQKSSMPKKELSKKPKMKTEDLALKKMRHAEKYAPGLDLDNIHSYELSQEAKKEKKVEKYQAGGIARMRPPAMGKVVDRDSKAAQNAARRKELFSQRMAAQKAARDARMAERAKPAQDRAAQRQATSARIRDTLAASRANRAARRAAANPSMGMAKGGKVHSDVKMDKTMIRKAVHKHESEKHPGESKTKLKKGGLPVHQGSPMYGRK